MAERSDRELVGDNTWLSTDTNRIKNGSNIKILVILKQIKIEFSCFKPPTLATLGT